MPTPDGSARSSTNVESWSLSINAVATSLPDLGRLLALDEARRNVETAQDEFVKAVLDGRAELACEGCGVVHSGAPTILRRGQRARRLNTSMGVLCFGLKQLTCRDCRRTWSPFAKLLGLTPRQRVAQELVRKLVECVTDLPYGKTCRLGEAWLGASLSPKTLHRYVQKLGSRLHFTPAPATAVVLADGTKVPAGLSERGMEVRFSFQILGRHEENGRTVVEKRIAGWGVGPGGWKDALPPGIATEVIVTDREKGLPKLLAEYFPNLRHQHCEWHLAHTMNHLLYLDGVKLAERKRLREALSKIVWCPTIVNRRERYQALCSELACSPKAYTMLVDARENVLFDVPSRERTTSVIEREMREINRRSDVGVRWSERGIDNLLRLRAAKRINRDDFERVWVVV
jgi:hypothetical protein